MAPRFVPYRLGRWVKLAAFGACAAVACTAVWSIPAARSCCNPGAEAIDVDHFCRRIVVEGNTLDRGGLAGIELNDVADSIIRGNRLSGYPVGIKCWHHEPCVMDGYNSGNRIEQNTILASGKHAVWFGRGTHDNVIAGNRHSPGLKQAAMVDLGKNNRREGNEEIAVPTPDAR